MLSALVEAFAIKVQDFVSASTGMGRAMDKAVLVHEMTVDTKCPTPLINEECLTAK